MNKENIYVVGRRLLYKELESLWEDLRHIDYAVIKGEVLSKWLYNNLNQRKSRDIDILIDRENIHVVEDALNKRGFVQYLSRAQKENRKNRILCMTSSHQIPSFHKRCFGFDLNVDINFDIFWGEYEGKKCSISEFLRDTNEIMNIYGSNVKTLSLEKNFVQLVLHHYKEMNSLYHLSKWHAIRKERFKDILYILKNNKEILSEEKVFELSDTYDIAPIMYYLLYYTEKVFPNEFLKSYLKKFDCVKDGHLINYYGLCAAERRKWKIPFEERLDNDFIWERIQGDISQNDQKKLALNNSIFT